MINCAVVGLGIGEQHAKALLAHPHVHLSAICDIDDNKTHYFLNKYSLHKTISKSFSEILIDPTIQVVSLATFDNKHFEQVLACLEHGKHVFVEKPLCQTKDQLLKIYHLWKKTRLSMASNLVLRKAPLYAWLKQAITADQFGTIYAIDADYLYGRIQKITEGWRSQIDNYSVLAGGGIHMIDLMIHFLNEKPVRVQSCVNKIATQNTQFRYHDFHATTFHFQNQAIGRITANFGCVHRHQHALRIFGTKATFIYDDMGARIHRTRDENTKSELIDHSPKMSDKGILLTDFIDLILEKKQSEIGQIEFDLMCSVLAADEAIQHHNSPVNIDYLTQ